MHLLFDFRQPTAAQGWSPINDGVMGGLSTSQLHSQPDGYASFGGHVSLANNGGFASVRTTPQQPTLAYPVDLCGFGGLALRVRGDGNHYQLRLRDTAAFDGIAHRVLFVAPAAWETVYLPFSQFEPVFRGRVQTGAPPLARATVYSFGLMIAQKQAGDFRLDIASIHAYTNETGQERAAARKREWQT